VKIKLFVIFFTLALMACVDQNTLTRKEIVKQSKADAFVSGVLFESDMDTQASYNTRKDGFVVIKFDESLTSKEYTGIVDTLRSSNELSGVRAEQGGREVCKLPGPVFFHD